MAADQRDLVGKGDVHIAIGVFQQLGEFGFPGAGGLNVALDEAAIEATDAAAASLVPASDNAVAGRSAAIGWPLATTSPTSDASSGPVVRGYMRCARIDPGNDRRIGVDAGYSEPTSGEDCCCREAGITETGDRCAVVEWCHESRSLMIRRLARPSP